MNDQPSGSAPDAGSVLKFVASLLWSSKWLIGAAVIAAAAVMFALYQPSTVQTWTGKTTLTIGLAPPTDFLLARSGSPLTAIETPRNAVARISDPIFRNKVLNQAAFESATAAFSRAMVSSSLRGVAGESDRDVEVELTAGSAADVQAAFRALAAEIGQEHGDILNHRLQYLRTRIEETKSRIALIEKASDNLNDRILNAGSDNKSQIPTSIQAPILAALVPAWSELRDRVQLDTNLEKLSEPSVLHLDANTYALASRSVGTLKASILAGLVMLAAIIILTIVVRTRVQTSAD
jgi:hypothetical protein